VEFIESHPFSFSLFLLFPTSSKRRGKKKEKKKKKKREEKHTLIFSKRMFGFQPMAFQDGLRFFLPIGENRRKKLLVSFSFSSPLGGEEKKKENVPLMFPPPNKTKVDSLFF
jgi:hypothetical protein